MPDGGSVRTLTHALSRRRLLSGSVRGAAATLITQYAGAQGAAPVALAVPVPAAPDAMASDASPPQGNLLPVDGASLYYELRGCGPLLLLIQGGAGDADSTPDLVDHLATHYTVLTYDRRGYSRSTLDGPAEPLTIQTHADDAHFLLAALTCHPVRVFGTSIGAVIGIDLLSRYADQVRLLVAHEPPLVELAPADSNNAALTAALRSGANPVQALQQFAFGLGIDPNDREPGVDPSPPPSPYAAQNARYFVTYDLNATAQYRLDRNALAQDAGQVVAAAGSIDRETQPYQAAVALGTLLGETLVEFPGSHNGYVRRPRAFAALLRDVLGD